MCFNIWFVIFVLDDWKGFPKFCSDVSESVSMSSCVCVIVVLFVIASACLIAISS